MTPEECTRWFLQHVRNSCLVKRPDGIGEWFRTETRLGNVAVGDNLDECIRKLAAMEGTVPVTGEVKP